MHTKLCATTAQSITHTNSLDRIELVWPSQMISILTIFSKHISRSAILRNLSSSSSFFLISPFDGGLLSLPSIDHAVLIENQIQLCCCSLLLFVSTHFFSIFFLLQINNKNRFCFIINYNHQAYQACSISLNHRCVLLDANMCLM